MPGKGREEPEVYRITGAQQARSDDMDKRIGRYLVSMLVRTICVILALVVPGPLRWVFVAGAVVLPYVAVVMANASGGPRTRPPATVFTHSPRAGLGSSATAAAPADPAAEEPLVGTIVGDEPVEPVEEPRRTVA